MMENDAILAVSTPIELTVRLSRERWELITGVKHPIMKNGMHNVQETLQLPDEIRRSESDDSVYLFYRRERTNRWTCVIVKQTNGDGFVITTYPTDSIKEGERVWIK